MAVVDLCVIGAGSAGLSVAAASAQLGLDTVLIEAGRMGGDCLNVGCVPSKSLIAAAAAAQAMRDAGRFGVHAEPPTIDFAAVIDHVHDVIAQIAPHDSVERFEGLGVRVIRAHARFVAADAVEVAGERIRARRFVVATGSRPATPSVPGIETTGYLTNETLFENRTLPSRLIVMGGGPIGCEMAQAFRRIGSQVVLVTRGTILPKDDPELVAAVRDRLRGEGVELLEDAEVRDAGPGVALRLTHGGRSLELEGSHLLVATGRKVVVDGLGLEAAGIAWTDKGITVDASGRTANRRIWAIGDCAGTPQFTHMAGHAAGIFVRKALFRLPARLETRAVPCVTYTDPELAHVGLTEAQAKREGASHEVLRFPLTGNDRARAERETAGLVKLVIGRRGKLLGASIVGHGAGDLILPFVLAVQGKVSLATLAGVIAPYPTLSEVAKQAAGKYFTPRLFAPRTRAVVRFLSRLWT